jgi:hypothetical protein
MGVLDDPVQADVALVPGAGAEPVIQEEGYAVDQGADGDDY